MSQHIPPFVPEPTPLKTVDYCAPGTWREESRERSIQRLRVIKYLLITVAIVVLCVIGLIACLYWWSWRTDHVVREWINGPHTDAVTFLGISGNGKLNPRAVTDPAALGALNKLLQTSSHSTFDSGGYSVDIEIHLQSGKVMSTIAEVSSHSITWMPPAGDYWGGWDFLTVQIDDQAPKALRDALPNAR